MKISWRVDMSNVLFLVSAILLIAILCTPRSCRADMADLYEKTARSVVVVAEPVGRSAGGGVILSRTTVVTSLHIVTDHSQVFLQFYDGIVVEGLVVTRDADNDLALIRVEVPTSARVAQLDLAMPAVGDDVFVVGHPNMLYWTFSRGYLAYPRTRSVRIAQEEHPTDILQVHAEVYSGSSGGGLFSMEGNLIGIGKGMAPATNIGYFVPSSAICERIIKCRGN